MRHLSLFILAPLLMTACSSKPPPVKEKVITVIEKDFSKILESNFRGQFSLSDDKGYFTACGADTTFLVNANFALRNIYEQISSTPNTPVYIEFTGEITFSKDKKSKVDSLMRIDRVHHMALAKASLQCDKPIDTFQFKANGDNPYWRLNIDNEKLYFATKASNQAYDIKNSNFRTTQINHVYTTNEKGQRLKLTIQPGHCYNLKNKKYWGYTANVSSIWGEFNGCGEPGWPTEDLLFNGYYLSNNNNITTDLTLNPDYTVELSEKHEGKETLKTGFWKSNAPNRVVVMLTKQENKHIRQEIVFQRNGLTLSTTEINKNNIIEPVIGEALVYYKMNAKEGVEEIKVNRIDREFTARSIKPGLGIDNDIQKAVNNYFKIHRTDPKNTQFSAVKYDLNGDGIDEALVLLDWCSPTSGCELLIFKGTQKGYQFSSRVSRVNAPITLAHSQHYLWQSLLVKKGENWSLLNFDGLSYPIHTRDLKVINKGDYATDVVLFSEGIPTQWFPVKM